jgi:hypothetical protein
MMIEGLLGHGTKVIKSKKIYELLHLVPRLSVLAALAQGHVGEGGPHLRTFIAPTRPTGIQWILFVDHKSRTLAARVGWVQTTGTHTTIYSICNVFSGCFSQAIPIEQACFLCLYNPGFYVLEHGFSPINSVVCEPDKHVLFLRAARSAGVRPVQPRTG